MSDRKACVIVGAGMSGLTAGRCLQDAGWDIVLLDKGRSFGGRMATRRIGSGCFDHGAQFFTVRDEGFAGAVGQWESVGWVVPWFASEGHTRYRAIEGMSSLARRLAERLHVRRETKIAGIGFANRKWSIVAESGEALGADALLLTPPAPQSAELLAGVKGRLPPDILSALQRISYDPCLTLLVNINGPGRVPAPGYIRPVGGPIEWIADNTAKGISYGGAALTIHARAGFSRDYFDEPDDTIVARMLLDASEPWTGRLTADWQLHRWKYSRAVASDRPLYLFSEEPAPLLIAGDGFGGPSLEGAYLSGLAAAQRLTDFRVSGQCFSVKSK